MNKITDFFKDSNQRFNLLMLVAFALLSFFVVMHHEIWRDEAYVWVLCRDCGFWELWKNVAIEGHPPLWYLLVLPLAKSGLAVFSMQVLAWIFAVLGAGFFVFKAPFSKFLKFSFLFSSGMFFWHAVVARSYSLFPLFIFILAFLHPKKRLHPYMYGFVLVLAANTHVILFAFCCALLAVFLWDEIIKYNVPLRQKIPQLTTFCAVAADFLFIGSSILWGKIQNVRITDYIRPDFWEVFEKLASGINGMSFFSYILVVFLGWFACVLYKHNKKLLFIFSASFVYQFLIYKYIWGILPQRAFSFLLVVLFCLWVLFEKRVKVFNYLQIVLGFIFLSSFLIGTKYVTQDLLFDFSGSKSTARYIKQNLQENALIVTDDSETKAGIFAYVPGLRLWSLSGGNFYTIEDWKQNLKERRTLELPEKFLNGDTYFITTRIGVPAFPHNVKCLPLYVNSGKVIHENEDFVICRLVKNDKIKTEKTDGR